MAGFAMILGGAMSGWSDARLDEIKSEREARLQELEAQRQDKRLADERSFRSQEAEIGRQHDTSMQDRSEKFQAGQNDLTRSAARENREDTQSYEAGQSDIDRTYRSGESQKERDFRLSEAQKTRDASGDLITDDQGNSYSRTGAKATPVVDDKGNPVKVASGGKAADKPAEVSTAEWLIQQGVATSPADAWKMVRSARSDPDKSRASIYKAWLDALTKGALGTPDAGELQKQAQDATEKTLQYLDEEPSNSGSGASQDSGADSVIPTDPAKRTVGKTYTNKNGQKAIWKGNGWEIVQ
ncbi:hypothetical protein [Mesorhizobium sp. B2-1-2]|uniref:hypothetical protein n=1 Tax=Mesorhizobium sp. B2-1-2 TaxID=2589973 RepID=UPI0011290FC4|nr:hypothetical protein [Mesorhizobium sp. B2-1-2]TPN11738.1 hypothetical protein FJ971_10050 [Mesorhizobium sp. B2-1-2]